MTELKAAKLENLKKAMDKKLLVIAHRGASQLSPENTLEAFQTAFETHCADMIEFDVQYSRDQIPVVIHDSTLERTTNGRGAVSHYTAKELQSLDAGFAFSREEGAFPWRGKNLKIPTLEEVLEAFPGRGFFIELKEPKATLVHEVIKIVGARSAENNTIITSQYHPVFQTMRRHYPQIPVAMSYFETARLSLLFKVGARHKVPSHPVCASMPLRLYRMAMDDPLWVDYLREIGIRTFFWTINDPETMKRLAALPADGLITDDPALMRNTLFKPGPETGPKAS